MQRLLFSKTTALADNRLRLPLLRMIAFSSPEDRIQKCVRTPVAFQTNIHTLKKKYRQVFLSVLFRNFVFALNHKIT